LPDQAERPGRPEGVVPLQLPAMGAIFGTDGKKRKHGTRIALHIRNKGKEKGADDELWGEEQISLKKSCQSCL
jgi:hypothetical protein